MRGTPYVGFAGGSGDHARHIPAQDGFDPGAGQPLHPLLRPSRPTRRSALDTSKENESLRPSSVVRFRQLVGHLSRGVGGAKTARWRFHGTASSPSFPCAKRRRTSSCSTACSIARNARPHPGDAGRSGGRRGLLHLRTRPDDGCGRSRDALRLGGYPLHDKIFVERFTAGRPSAALAAQMQELQRMSQAQGLTLLDHARRPQAPRALQRRGRQHPRQRAHRRPVPRLMPARLASARPAGRRTVAAAGASHPGGSAESCRARSRWPPATA